MLYCTYLKANENSTHFGGRCFCYSSGTVIKWKDIWSSFQVHVIGEDGVHLVYPMETRNCREPEDVITLAKCLFDHYWPSSSTGEKSLDIPLVDQDVCFMVKSKRASVQYTLQVSGKRLNRVNFSLFITGLALFYFAGALCRSSLFYYSAGVSLGVISIFIFLLFVLKHFIPKRGVFLMLFGASSSLSYLGFQQLLANWEEVMSMYWREVLGYLLVSGFISFAVCYKRGPITDERTLALATWVLQIVAMAMMYHGITYPTAAYVVLAGLLGLKCLPYLYGLLLATCRQTGQVLRSGVGVLRKPRWWRKPRVRLLTEEEYREQGEVHTRASLEALREHCTSADFPAWDTVLRLRAPQRFAGFLRGGSHLTPQESQTHDQQYGLGGAYYEGMIFPGQGRGPPAGRGAPQQGAGDDLSEEEQEYYEPTQAFPPPAPLRSPTPLRSLAPSLPARSAIPLPPAYTPPACPYPALPYSPHSDATATEDLELF
ncbi:nuclear envelope integral membrane protein 2 isoform X2 [Conger conger]|uniref:nuclear envelope integral membrane protein 2 isoform X2 n=1 Tax=Conger conger TaxID=82655 RepID=UPI002A5AD0A3|nr:nuclear envelope integral membrane protein 2 isoform X2 [Conger conger]